MRMWEWWRKVEEDYREKRRREDELKERERRERARRQTADEALAEVQKSPPVPFEELVAEMERNWGIDVDWEEWGMVRPKPRGIQIEVVLGEEKARQEGGLQKSEGEKLAEGALLLVLTGRFGMR